MTSLARVGLLCIASALSMHTAMAQGAGGARKAFRVCLDPSNLPFANIQGDGIENKLAELFGKSLGLPVTYYAFPQRFAFVRNTLKYKLPGEEYPCDILMGVPVGFDQVSVTKPYYTSTYAMVFARGVNKALDGVASTEDFLKLPPETLKSLRIGVYDKSPASEWLRKHQLVDQGVPYRMLNSDPQQYPGEIIEKDLAAGKLDVAIVWGPMGGYFAKNVKAPALTVVPMASEPGVKFDYAVAMGVRYGEREWKGTIEGLIDKHRADIQSILTSYGVPLVGAPTQPTPP